MLLFEHKQEINKTSIHISSFKHFSSTCGMQIFERDFQQGQHNAWDNTHWIRLVFTSIFAFMILNWLEVFVGGGVCFFAFSFHKWLLNTEWNTPKKNIVFLYLGKKLLLLKWSLQGNRHPNWRGFLWNFGKSFITQ